MLIVSVTALTCNYNRDQLATTGIYGLVRNPIYSAWILFLLPGLALLSRSWPLLLTPVVAYVVFKLRIGRENEYLERRFGDTYRRYQSEVNELVPIPRGGRSW
jgi:protein-S-isoprenylcysteine O-methyltransferase Ste14